MEFGQSKPQYLCQLKVLQWVRHQAEMHLNSGNFACIRGKILESVRAANCQNKLGAQSSARQNANVGCPSQSFVVNLRIAIAFIEPGNMNEVAAKGYSGL